MLVNTAQAIRNLRTPASADMNKRGFLEQASPAPLPNPPSLFPFLPIPYPLPLSTPATQARIIRGIPLVNFLKTGVRACMNFSPFLKSPSAAGLSPPQRPRGWRERKRERASIPSSPARFLFLFPIRERQQGWRQGEGPLSGACNSRRRLQFRQPGKQLRL